MTCILYEAKYSLTLINYIIIMEVKFGIAHNYSISIMSKHNSLGTWVLKYSHISLFLIKEPVDITGSGLKGGGGGVKIFELTRLHAHGMMSEVKLFSSFL